MKKPPQPFSSVYALLVNLTTFYISFRIEKVKYLGLVKDRNKIAFPKEMHAVEGIDEGVEYLDLEDLHKSEKDAELALAKIIASKYNREIVIVPNLIP